MHVVASLSPRHLRQRTSPARPPAAVPLWPRVARRGGGHGRIGMSMRGVLGARPEGHGDDGGGGRRCTWLGQSDTTGLPLPSPLDRQHSRPWEEALLACATWTISPSVVCKGGPVICRRSDAAAVCLSYVLRVQRTRPAAYGTASSSGGSRINSLGGPTWHVKLS